MTPGNASASASLTLMTVLFTTHSITLVLCQVEYNTDKLLKFYYIRIVNRGQFAFFVPTSVETILLQNFYKHKSNHYFHVEKIIRYSLLINKILVYVKSSELTWEKPTRTTKQRNMSTTPCYVCICIEDLSQAYIQSLRKYEILVIKEHTITHFNWIANLLLNDY